MGWSLLRLRYGSRTERQPPDKRWTAAIQSTAVPCNGGETVVGKLRPGGLSARWHTPVSQHLNLRCGAGAWPWLERQATRMP